MVQTPISTQLTILKIQSLTHIRCLERMTRRMAFTGGSLMEMLMFNPAISTPNRQLAEGHLAWKWGLQLECLVFTPLCGCTALFTWNIHS
jgi:hypothetical protein